MTAIPVDYEVVCRDSAKLTFRSIKYFLAFLLAWQGNPISGSLVQIGTFLPIYGWFAPDETFITLLFILLVAERSVTGDFTIKRSYFGGPVLLILLALFISWCRGCVATQRVAFVYEAHEAVLLPVTLPILLNLFRDKEDRWALYRILLLAPIWKAIDGATVFFWSTDPNKGWGVLQTWRDGYLLGVGIVGVVLLLHYAPQSLKRTRNWVLYTAPILGFTLLMSYRRTFMVGGAVALFALIFMLPKERRKRHYWIIAGFFLSLTILTLVTDPISIIARLAGIVDPWDEGSAYIRLLEYPNVLMNIVHNPIWGTAIGTKWVQYFRMPVSAVYTTYGCHNTYLYYQLRAGILGSAGFFWLLARMWKWSMINYRLRKTEDDEFFGQYNMQLIIVYQVGCFFGLMYADATSPLLAMILVAMQLHGEQLTGQYSYADIGLLETWKNRRLIPNFRAPRYRIWRWLEARRTATSG